MNNFQYMDSISVTNQYKLEDISYNQCSWFCIEILLELKKLDWKLDLSNKEALVSWYNQTLINASEKRKIHGKLSWGESLFSNTIHSSNNYSLYITSIKKCEYGVDFSEKNLIFIDKMRDIQKYKDELTSISFQEIQKNIRNAYNEKKYVMINRFGQSFLIFPIDYDKFVIFDSHKSEIIITNSMNLQMYILQNPSSYNFIIYVEGIMNQLVMFDSMRNILYRD